MKPTVSILLRWTPRNQSDFLRPPNPVFSKPQNQIFTKMKYFIIAILLCSSWLGHAQWTSGRPDGHAPIGVMGDHTHGQGEVMFSYRYMFMDMADMREGTSTLSNADVLADFMVTPTEMPMHMHMLGAMYAISDELTTMVMVNFLDQSMDHVTGMGTTFETASGGFGDIRVSGLYKVLDQGKSRLHLNLGLSIPTGSIDEKDVTPASSPNEAQLPYPMQVGSGTFDLLPGATYLYQQEKTSLGLQVMGILRLGDNDREYTLGNRFQGTVWSAYKLSELFSASLRLTALNVGEIDGADPTFTMLGMVPTVVPENFGGTYLNLGGGFNFYVPEGTFKNVRLGIEYELPVVQDLNGPQMETQGILTLGIQYSL